jgi:hypothetical protein
VFREHKRNQLRRDLELLSSYVTDKMRVAKSVEPQLSALSNFLRIISLDALNGPPDVIAQTIFHNSVMKFGVGNYVARLTQTKAESQTLLQEIEALPDHNCTFTASESIKSKKKAKTLENPSLNSAFDTLLLQFKEKIQHYVHADGTLNFSEVFSDQPELPIKLEICSGNGEWVVQQVTGCSFRIGCN